MRLIDADDFGNRMYHEAFGKDSDLQKWDSGCWIRYKLFENVLREQPTVQPDHTADISKKADGDCISRQAAIEALRDRYYKYDRFAKIEELVWAIEALPSAQPEIIYCKDCKHRYLDGMIWNCPFGLSGGEDFFCAYGAIGGGSGT